MKIPSVDKHINDFYYYRKDKPCTQPQNNGAACAKILEVISSISGIPDYMIDNYELGRGEIRLHALIKIAIAMNIEVRNLFERT